MVHHTICALNHHSAYCYCTYTYSIYTGYKAKRRIPFSPVKVHYCKLQYFTSPPFLSTIFHTNCFLLCSSTNPCRVCLASSPTSKRASASLMLIAIQGRPQLIRSPLQQIKAYYAPLTFSLNQSQKTKAYAQCLSRSLNRCTHIKIDRKRSPETCSNVI